MLAYTDLVAARAAIHNGVNPLEVRDALLALDAGSIGLTEDGSSLLALLRSRGKLDAEVGDRARQQADRYVFLRRESAFLHILREESGIDIPKLKQCRETQVAENYTRPLADYLVQAGVLTPAADIRISSRAEKALEREDERQLAKSRAESFFDIEGMPTEQRRTFEDGQEVAVSRIVDREQAEAMMQRLKDDEATAGYCEVPAGAAPPPPPPTPPAPPAPPAPPTPPTFASGPKGRRPSEFETGRRPALTRDFSADELAASLGDPLQGTGLSERYKVIDKLGEGNMGAVYLAEQLEEGRRCALKVMLAKEKNEEGVQRFRREILCNSFFSHPGVVEIYDGGPTDDGSYFMAMEYVQGEPLSERINREGPLRLRDALAVWEQAVVAMKAAHDAKIIHRDLKPENFLCRENADGSLTIKIMDWGIARILDDEQDFSDQFFKTMHGKLTGSPAYVAPESITEPKVDIRADLYSLGIILYELTVGQVPFRGKNAQEYLQKQLYTKPPDPEETGAHRGITPALAKLILQLLQKLPKKRPDDADAVLALLRTTVLPELEQPKSQATMAYDPKALRQALDAGDMALEEAKAAGGRPDTEKFSPAAAGETDGDAAGDGSAPAQAAAADASSDASAESDSGSDAKAESSGGWLSSIKKKFLGK